MRVEDILGLAIRLGDDAMDFFIDLVGGLLGIVLGMTHISADEDLTVAGGVVDRAQCLGHTVLDHHVGRGLGRLFDIVGSAGGDIAHDQGFCHTAAEIDHDLLLHLTLGAIAAILGRQRHRITARHTARDDGDLVHGILRLTRVEADRVTGFMIRSELLLTLVHDLTLLLGADHYLDRGFLDLRLGDRLFILARGEQRRLVQEVRQIRAGKACGLLRDIAELDVGRQGLFTGMDAKDRFTAVDIGITDHDLTVESTGSQECGVEDIGTVGRRDHDDALVCAEAVHLDQQLVERLLTLIVTAAETRASLAADSVDLIDEDDTG